MPALLAVIRPFWTLGAAALVALACPWAACSDCAAPLQPEITVFWLVIPAIFFMEGLSLPTSAMWEATGRVGFHVSALCFNFGLVPAAIFGLSRALLTQPNQTSSALCEGLFALAAVPTTTSMNVMHTTASGGNAPVAAVSAVLGNVLALWATPALLKALGAQVGSISFLSLAVSVAGKMVVPLLAGQCVRAWKGHVLAEHKPALVSITRLLQTLLMFQVFSDCFYWGHAIAPLLLLVVLPVAVALHLLFLALAWAWGSLLLRLPLPDTIAFTFCSAQKTVVLGLPLLRACFADRTPQARAQILLPLIGFHLFSLIFGFPLAARFRQLVEAQPLHQPLAQ